MSQPSQCVLTKNSMTFLPQAKNRYSLLRRAVPLGFWFEFDMKIFTSTWLFFRDQQMSTWLRFEHSSVIYTYNLIIYLNIQHNICVYIYYRCNFIALTYCQKRKEQFHLFVMFDKSLHYLIWQSNSSSSYHHAQSSQIIICVYRYDGLSETKTYTICSTRCNQ